MKSIYSKLIFGFFVTIITSFAVAGFVFIKNNNNQVRSSMEEDLSSTLVFVSTILQNDNIDNKDEIIELYSSSSSISITYNMEDSGFHYYGKQSYFPSESVLEQVSHTHKKETFVDTKDDVLYYGKHDLVNGNDYFIYACKDMSAQKNIFTNSAVLILGCIFLTGSIVFLAVADIIVRPISRLTKAIKELSNGNYSVRVDTVGEDEISKLNQGFNQMAIQLAKQDEIRQKFISDVSHEFQTPLTSIQGFANILKEEDLPKEQREKYANIILYNSKRLSSLAKNMLQLTLLDSEEIQLDISTFSLTEQMKRVVSTQESLAKEKDIEIDLQLPKKDILYDGDENRLEQVWTNIISNAIKYTNEHGLITVTVKRNVKDIEIEVEDTGIGMSQQVIAHIFERFYREDKARSVDGNGLGLAIVKSIVDLHKGKIEVESTVDVGSIFRINLPIDKGDLKDRLHINGIIS